MSGAGFGRIGEYELRGILGRGGMAIVYRAYSPRLRREVALKVLTAPESKIDLLRERFRREAQVVGRLNHPNILPLLDSSEENGVPYLVMELIEGGSLNTRLGRPLPPEQALAIARQIGSALDYAHERGIVHRDVKPANIFLAGQRAVLADFGIVKVFGEIGPKLTQTGVGVGTPEYTAPEQATGGTLDGRSDLYALGIVLYEMLTGKPPYQGGTMDVINAHVQGQLPDPRGRNPALPQAVSAVLVKALAKRQDGRYPTGAALADALESAITGTRPVPLPNADAPAQTMVLDRTREMLLQTQIHQQPPPPGVDATIVGQRPTPTPTSGNTPPPRSALPPTPSALPPVPSLPSAGATPDDRPTQRPATPTPEPPRALPPTPLATARVTPPPPPSQPADTYVPQGQTLPAVLPGQMPPPQYQTPLPPPVAAPNMLYQPPVMMPPPAPPLPPPAGPSNRPIVIGLAAVAILLLVLVGIGGVYFARRNTNTTPTVTAAARISPTITPTIAAAAASANPMITPSATARAVTATPAAASDPAKEQIATGDAALQNGQFNEAIAAYKAGLAANPKSAVANRQLGLALWVWNHDPGEIDYLDQATKLDPNDALAWAYLAYSSVDTHQSVRAYDAAYRAIAANGNEPVAHAALANVYLNYPPDPAKPESGKGEARQEVDKAKALDPNNLWVLWSEHILLANEEKYQEAFAPLEKMIEQRSKWATLYYAKGVLYDLLDQTDNARTWQEKSLAIDPDYPYALTELGWLAYNGGDYQGAKKYFDQALVLIDEVSVRAHTGLGYTLLELGDVDNAVRNCQRAAGIDTHDPSGFLCLGYVFEFGTKDYPNAISSYRKGIELRPYWETGYIGVARVQSGQKDNVSAEATLKQGLSLVNKPKYIHYWLGWVLYQQGKYQEAQPNLERAAELLPDDAELQYLLGQNLEKLNRFPEARAAYEKALAIKPDYADAQAALKRLSDQGH
ncbi:MAG: protein kinase [Chloroflexia bacterium]